MLIYDVIIPVYRPDEKLKRLINALLSQSLLPRRIILINTEREEFLKFSPEEEFLAQSPRLKLYHISKAEFNHGSTRNYGVSLSDAPFFVCMTDDAIPAGNTMMEELLKPFVSESIGVSYARQLPDPDCGIIERYTRSFNYPEKERIKTAKDLPELGIKTFLPPMCAQPTGEVILTHWEDSRIIRFLMRT